ncbi:MAG TPA: site-specific integrase [Rhodospirillales bacterium]|nr:site-specific integrase [Rhodospirillales bacterium]
MALRLWRRKRGGPWYIRGTVRGIRVYETTGTTDRALAREILAARERQLIERSLYGDRAVRTFADAALSYLEAAPRSPATQAYVRRLLDHFCPGWQGGGSGCHWTRLARIDQVAVDRCLAAVLRPGAAPATKARVLSVLNAVLRHAARRGWCDLPMFERIRLPRGRTVYLTPAEAERLLEASADHLRPLLHFILCTGARLSEALELAWRDVHLADHRVVFRVTKSGRDRVAALPEAAVVLLANMEGEREGPVFRRPDGRPYADRGRQAGGQIKRSFATACRRAGLGEWQGRRFRPALTPHGLRHTWASWFYAVSKDPMLLRQEGGWATLAMVERYAHLAPPGIVPEIARIWGAWHPRLGALPVGGAVPAATALSG